MPVVLPYTTEEILRLSRQRSETMHTQPASLEERGASLQKTETTRASDVVSAFTRPILKLEEDLRRLCDPFETSTAQLGAVASAFAALQTPLTGLKLLKPSGALYEQLQFLETERQRQQAEATKHRLSQEGFSRLQITGPPPNYSRPMTAPPRRPGYRSVVPKSDILWPPGTKPLKPDTATPGQPGQVSNTKRTTSRVGRPRIPQSDLKRFQEALRNAIYFIVGDYGKKRKIGIEEVKYKMSLFLPGLTEKKWRTRYDATCQQWGCGKGRGKWEKLIAYILNTRT